MAYNERRWGSDAWTRQLRTAGQADGCKFGGWVWWPATLQGHRLVLLAQRKGGPALGDRAKDVLFRLAYEESKNISDTATLLEAAKELGLDEDGAVAAFLKSDDGRAEVSERPWTPTTVLVDAHAVCGCCR